VWSAWSNPVDLYLGQGLILVGRGKQQAMAIPFPPTLPLDVALRRAGEAAGALLRKGAALRVRLSGALCPAMTFGIPKGISGWREIGEVARTSIAVQMNLPAADVAIQTDPSHLGLATALARPFLGQLQSWAKEGELAMRSLSPLWTEVAGCERARSERVGAIVLAEPDGVTVLVEARDGIFAATARPSNEEIDALNRLLASKGVTDEASLKLKFSAAHGESMRGLPRFLAANWSAL
jgi:hypothetical protein